MFKVNYRNPRTRCEICSKLTIKIPEQSHWRSGISIVNFEQISNLAQMFSIVNFEHVIAGWEWILPFIVSVDFKTRNKIC